MQSNTGIFKATNSEPQKESDWILKSHWIANEEDNGKLILTVFNHSKQEAKAIKLCFTSQLTALSAASVTGGQLILTDGGYNEIIRSSQKALESGEVWAIELTDLRFKPAHANDGPITAFVISENSEPQHASVVPMTSSHESSDYSAGPADCDELIEPSLGVIPYPNELALAPGRGNLPVAFFLSINCSDQIIRQIEIVKETFSLLFPDESDIFLSESAGMQVEVFLVDASPESYQIQFETHQISIEAADLAGVFYAAVSLCQMVRAARLNPLQYYYPSEQSQISDAPRFSWRGAHLDVARRYYPMSDLKRFIAINAWYKINRFHWHLTDDEGWRVEIKAYPELTGVGSKRGYGHLIPPQFNDEPEISGGYYTQDDVKEIVAFASDRHIEVMPEIDMPAHSTAALRSLPWLADATEDAKSYVSVHGFHNNSLNPALAVSEQFIKTVIDELVPLFPFEVFHVGGDEVPDLAWHTSSEARALTGKLKQSSTSALHGYFVERLQRHLSKNNKVMGIWDDGVSEALDASETLVFAWRDSAIGAKLASLGHNVVMTPGQFYYLDMARSTEWSEPGACWAGSTSTFECYNFEVQPGAGSAETFSGVQCGIWSEHMANKRVFNHLVYPRLLAVAESGWTAQENKSWMRFNAISEELSGPWQI